MNALVLAQAVADGDSDTAIVVAVITAVGIVLGALVTVLGQRSGARLDAIEKNQAGLGAAIERLERRMEEGLARLADRIDRLFEHNASVTPRKTETKPEAEEDDSVAAVTLGLDELADLLSRAAGGPGLGAAMTDEPVEVPEEPEVPEAGRKRPQP